MKLIIVFLIICLAAVVKSQFFGGFNSLGSFSGGLDAPLTSARDPRQNTGPVVFPPSPGDNGETSGVVVGASGYGFIPPGQSGASPNN